MGNAWGLGLGEATGQVVIGQPLRVEIPLLGTDGNQFASSCFRVRPPVADIGNEFALRNGSIQVVGERGATKLVVTTATPIREPLIGFAIAAGCGFELSKDYVLLTIFPNDSGAEVALPQPAQRPTLPGTTVSAPAAPPAPSTAPTVAPVTARPALLAAARRTAPPPKTMAATSSDQTLRVDADATLEDLARQRYPLQPKARKKFMRMMAEANPGLSTNDAVIAAGSELQVPKGLPQRRTGPYLEEGATAKPAQVAAPATASSPVAKPAPAGKDRLVVGGGGEMSEAKLLAEAERLTTILIEQTKFQDAVTETITKLEGTYSKLQKHYASLDNRVNRIEAERLAEKQAPKPASFDFFELLLAVLSGGVIGGLLLYVFQRQQMRRNPHAENTPAAPPTTSVGFKLPWAKHATPEPIAAAVTVMVDSGQAPMAPAVAPASAKVDAPPVMPEFLKEFLKSKSPGTASPVPETTAPGDAQSLEFGLMPEPAEEAPVATEVTQTSADVLEASVPEEAFVPAVATQTDVESPSLEPLLHDFPLIPEAPPEALHELQVPATDTTAASSPAATPNEAPAQETLALDFPAIPIAAAATPEDDNVIEFESVTNEPGSLELPKI
jgi:hypothetical protein